MLGFDSLGDKEPYCGFKPLHNWFTANTREGAEPQTVHTVIIRSDVDGRKKHHALVSILHAYFVKETLLHQSNTMHLYTIPTHGLSIKTQQLSVSADIFGLPDTGTVNPVSSNHHHAREKSFAIVPLHPFTHGAPEYRGNLALPALSVQFP